ncbi:MAG: GNAT family N-acetyltransferase, partial [Rhodanobacter sp.]
MLSIEQALVERMPWLARHPAIRRPMAGFFGRLADESTFNRVLEQAGPVRGFHFVDRTLELLGTRSRILPHQRENIPVDGPLLVVANHPLGMQDALALLQLIGSVRRDVRVLGNDWLAVVPQLGELLLPVDVFGDGAASRLRGIYRALDNGEALIVFPAGEVSRVRATGVRDGRWSDGFARLALRRKVPVLPIHVAARNSAVFYGVSMLAKPLSTAMLPREAVAAGQRRIGFQIGALIDPDELASRSGASPKRAAVLMRRHVYRVARGRGLIFGGQVALAHPEPVRALVDGLASAEKLGDLSDGKQVLLFTGSCDSAVLREIGR